MGLNVETPNAPYILAQWAVPVILAPNGTVATNGTITLGTALPTTYSGGAWVRLPAAAVVGDAAGTIHYAVFSSTTVGVIYTLTADAAVAFTPYIPTVALVAATGSNSAYTQTISADITLANVTVPGGAMGASGKLRVEDATQTNNSAGTKTVKVALLTANMLTANLSTSVGSRRMSTIQNAGLLTSQKGHTATQGIAQGPGTGTTTGVMLVSAINTGIAQPLTFTGQLAVATDYIVLEAATVEILPS